MATSAEVTAFRAVSSDIVTLSQTELLALWDALGSSPPALVAATLEDLFPALVATYGDMAAVVAVDFFEELRYGAGLTDSYRPSLPSQVVDVRQAQRSSRWATSALFDPELIEAGTAAETALSRLSGVTQRLVRAPGRAAIFEAVRRDPAGAGYAHIPEPGACAFCRMVASRGVVYLRGASDVLSAGRGFHDNCNCEVVPVWDPERDLPADFDLSALQAEYASAYSSDGWRETLANMREASGLPH